MVVGGTWTRSEADIEAALYWHNSSGVWPHLRNEKLFYMEIFGNTHCGPVAGLRPTHAPSHYPPWQPSGSRCMSKVGTWFLKVHVTSLDRIWPKLNRSSGAFGEKCIFGCFKGLLAIFLLERCIVFFSESVELNNKFFGNKKMGVALQKMVIWRQKL